MIIVPLMQICWTLFSIVSGMLYFEEYKTFAPAHAKYGAANAIIFCLGVLVSKPQSCSAGQLYVFLAVCKSQYEHISLPCCSLYVLLLLVMAGCVHWSVPADQVWSTC
jgi:hypothetical protein